MGGKKLGKIGIKVYGKIRYAWKTVQEIFPRSVGR
jgi:hypothetical protein